MFVNVHFLHDSLGENMVRVYGPFETEQEAKDDLSSTFRRADKEVKTVELHK